MAKTRRNYSGTSVSTTTQTQILATGTNPFTVQDATNWPYGSEPFTVVVDPETASEEKMLVTRTNIGDTQINIVERAFDGTSAVEHANGATTFPVFTALDADEANELTSMWESKGDIVSYGTATFGRVPVGSDDTVLIADSGASSGLSWGQVDTDQLANDAVTADKIALDAVGSSEIASGAVTENKLDDDAVTTAKIANDAITNDKIATNAVNADSIAAGAVCSSELASTTVTAGSYGNSENYTSFTVDADGRLTAASNVGLGQWSSYNPVLTGSVTNPTLGTGGIAEGYYTRVGDLVVASIRIKFGTSGVSNGSGNYFISLPVNAEQFAGIIMGHTWIFDSSGNYSVSGIAQWANPSQCYIYNSYGAIPGPVSSAIPFIWTDNDEMRLHLSYRAS